MSAAVQVYDKAEWHLEEVRKLGLPAACAAHHLAFMIRWLAEQKALTDGFWSDMRTDGRHELPLRLEDWGKVVLTNDMVRDDLRPFVASYMGDGGFQEDYREVLALDLPTIYHVEYSEANYARFAARLDQRHEEWLHNPGAWQSKLPQWRPTGCALVLKNTVFRAPKATALGCLLIGLGVFAGLLWSMLAVIRLVLESIGSMMRGTVLESPMVLLAVGILGWLLWKSARTRA